ALPADCAAEGSPIDDQVDDWELIDSSEIPSLSLTAQGRIDFARPTHEQCDRVDWIGAIVSAPNGKLIIHKRWVHYMQVLAYADVSSMFMKYESFFLTILTGIDGIPTDPMLYRQKYTNAFLEYEEDPLECLLNSAPAPTKTLPVNSGFSPNRTPTTESIQRVDTQSCTTEIDPRAQRWISQHAPFRVSHYGDSDTTQSSLSSSDIRVPIPSDEMTIPTGTEASEPPYYQVDAHPSVQQTIISDDAPIVPPTDLQTTDANPCATQPVISHQADEIDAPILRTVTFEDDESVNEPNPCERAGTSDALPEPTQARNTTTDNAEYHIAQFIHSVNQHSHFTTQRTYKPGDPLDPELLGTEPPHHSLHNFSAGLAKDIMSFSRHSLRPAFANNTHHHVSTDSAPICPVSEPTGSSLQDHDGDNDNVPPPTTSTTNPTADDGFTQVGGPQRIKYINAPTIGENNVGTSGEDNAQNFARSASKPQDSHGPQARNHRRNIRRRNKRKAARMSSQAQKKTYAMSSGRADNRVQLFTEKASKSSGMEIYHAGYTASPEEKVNTHFRDEQHNRRANFARKKTHATSSGKKAGNQDKLRKKKVDKQLLDNALYQTGSSLHQIPPQEYTMRAQQCYLTRDPNRFASNDFTHGR
ncbi:hypothetical protein THAOC_05929, partial [Thalassiosira oceanica]